MKPKKSKSKIAYSQIYVPKSKTKERDACRKALRDIDCNLSKIICLLFSEITEAAQTISMANKNYRHYNWTIVVDDYVQI